MVSRDRGTFDITVSECGAAAVRRYLDEESLEAPDAVHTCGARMVTFRWGHIRGVQRGSLIRLEIGGPCRLLVDGKMTTLEPEQRGGISEMRAATSAEVWRGLLRAILSPCSIASPIVEAVVGLGPRASAWIVPNVSAFKGSPASRPAPWRRVAVVLEDDAARGLAEIGATIGAVQKRCAPEVSLHLGIVAAGHAPQMLAFAA